MLNTRNTWHLGLTFLLTASLLTAAVPKQKKPPPPCSEPPQLMPGPKPSKEEQKRARKERMQSLIAAVISENGDVIDTKVVHASSDEAGKMLRDNVKSMKFKPRPGCGVYTTQFNFTLAK